MAQYNCKPVLGELVGDFCLPGDKSLSHRALILAALAEGETKITGFLPGEDNLATMNALRALGVTIAHTEHSDKVLVSGVGLHGLLPPAAALDFGNAGTGIRLLMGVMVWQRFSVLLTGDESLRKRPMGRVADPLTQMGALINVSPGGVAPIKILPCEGGLSSLEYTLPVSSAQIKSALLFAGLAGDEEVVIHDPGCSRDHTERMMRYLGIPVESDGDTVRLSGVSGYKAKAIDIVSDISSAAFFLVAASIVPGSELLLKSVGVNPTRTGVITLLRRMGADITQESERESRGGEPYADIRVRYAQLKGIEITAEDVPAAVDELPVIMVAAACASGRTDLSGAVELRMKECDRIAGVVAGLQAMGIEVEERPDGMTVMGGHLQGGARVDTFGDHRLAMAFAVASARATGPTCILGTEIVQTSFPGFVTLATSIGMNLSEE